MTPRTGYTSRPNANCAPATKAAPAGYRRHSRRGNARAITSAGLSLGIGGGYRVFFESSGQETASQHTDFDYFGSWSGRSFGLSGLPFQSR